MAETIYYFIPAHEAEVLEDCLQAAMNPSRRIVYVAHPLAGDVLGNMREVIQICRDISRLYTGTVPVTPLLAFSFLREPDERELALEYCLTLLERCDELWLTGDWRNSEGCRMELERARELGMPVVEWVRGKAVPIGHGT